MHIGLIGGIGPAATLFYYQRIVSALARVGISPELTIGHTSALMLSQNIGTGNQQAQAEEFLRVTRQLQGAGADVVVISSMGGHFCADAFIPISPLPLIAGPPAVAAHLKAEGIRNIGILGTRVVMQTALYGALGDINAVVPKGEALAAVNQDYVAVAIAGEADAGQRQRLLDAGKRLVREQGADAVLLGGTDLNVVYDSADYDFKVIDSAQVHVDVIVEAIKHAA